MALGRTETERKRRAFLHALGAGRSVVEAADHAGIGWSTLYAWRQNAAGFRAGWDRAAARARDALADRLRAALIERAVVGIDEPVFYNGERVGTRKRYSDALLLAGLHEATAPRSAAAPARPVVVIRRFSEEKKTDKTLDTPAEPHQVAPAAPALAASEPRLLPQPPAPAEPPPDQPLRWDHLGRRDEAD